MNSPLFNTGLFLVILGVSILLFPHLLQLFVALALIGSGAMLMRIEYLRRK